MGNRWRYLTWCIASLLAAGCSSASREEMSSAVLQDDPAFATVLEQHHAIEHHVDDLREQLTAARINAEQQIRGIRQEFRETHMRLQNQITALTAQLQPERDRLSLEITTTRHHLQTQEAVVRGLKQMAADLQKSLTSSAAATPATGAPVPPTGAEPSIGITTAQEHAVTEAHVADVQQQLQTAQRTLEETRLRLKLLQYKLRLLRIE